MALVAKNPLAMQESKERLVRSLSPEDPLEEGTATYSSILAWRTPWTEEPGGLQSIEPQRVRHDGSDLAHPQAITTVRDVYQCSQSVARQKIKDNYNYKP